jgi:hypothetical protein
MTGGLGAENRTGLITLCKCVSNDLWTHRRHHATPNQRAGWEWMDATKAMRDRAGPRAVMARRSQGTRSRYVREYTGMRGGEE